MKRIMKKVLSLILVMLICITSIPLCYATETNSIQIPVDAVEFNGHYYQLYDLGLTWDEAKEYCKSLGGHLVTITSQEEQNTVETILSKGNKNVYWLGGEKVSNSWQWITDESWGDYTNWAYKQPDNWYYNEEKLSIYKNENPGASGNNFGTWNDMCYDGTCGEQAFFGLNNVGLICEWDDVSIEQYPDGYGYNQDRYYFGNFNEKIDKEIYKKVFGSDKGARLHLFHELGKHGHCYGMAATTAALLKYPYAINQFKCPDLESGYAYFLMNVEKPEFMNELFGVDARTYIKYGHVYQYDSYVSKAEKATTDNIIGLYNAVNRYVMGTGDYVIINIYHDGLVSRKDGHSLFAVGTLEENGKKYILVNDSNARSEPRKMEINTESSRWEYNVDGLYNYSSENGFFTYSFPADMVYKIGLLLNSNHSEFLSTNNNLVTSTSDISANCALQEIYSTSGTNETDSTTKLYWAEEYAEEIEITATEDNSTISVSDNNSSVTVEIDTSDSANFFVDDDSNNSVVLNCTDEENVDISFKTANCSGNEVEIVVSATANDDSVTASLTDNGISISGVSDGDVSVVKYDEIVETKAITENESEVEIETELPNAGHNFVDGVCIDCGERTIQLEEMSSQIRFNRNDDGSYAETFDVRTRAMISDKDFTELVGSTNTEAVKNIDKIGFVYTLDGENFSANSAQAVAQGEKVTGYIDAPVKYIQDADGYYMFTCLVTDIPKTDKNYILTAYAYICVNGKWYFSEEPMNADFNSLCSTYYPIACEKYGWEV